MILRALLLTLLLAMPAEALTITDVRLNCAGVNLFGGTVINVVCEGQGLWLDAVIHGFPTTTPVAVHMALTVGGVELGTRDLTLPSDLGLCSGCDGGHYTGAGVGWRLPLEALCHEGCTGAAVASVLASGESLADPEVMFDLDVPTPEPATLLMVGTTFVLIGWRVRRGR